jgi:hypothetical protein
MTGSKPDSGGGWALPIGALAFSTAAVLTLAAAPGRADAMAAVYPPWWTPARAAASATAEGDLQAIGGIATILVVRSDRPDLAHRLRASGALFLIDSRLASVCATPA